ncbi:hypothetical protein [Paracidovorax avenae]|uniref:hypothetical protein n=1 Tax=Paracidovorax avenae TaxID=80867 RepID=UPI00126036AE|nr:hypothetical protein [Paracidovorax avenae]
MTSKFTQRLGYALEDVVKDVSMKCHFARTNCLYTPTYERGKYVWLKLMDSDGTLLSERPVHPKDGEGIAPEENTRLLLGVIIQSEDSTSQTKPNPLGKASLSHVPNGVWVDTPEGLRRRLDHFVVTFVLPRGTSVKHRSRFLRSRKNVLNAATVMPNAVAVEVNRGDSAKKIADLLKMELRPFVVGKGRPRSEA